MNDQLTAFKKLSSSLQAKITSRPTKTLLADSSKEIKTSYINVNRLWNFEEPDPVNRVPESFDGRVTWEGLLGKVKNQGGCGSCWAFASTTMLAQRFNIQSRGLMNIALSQTKLILCDLGGKELEIDHPEESGTTSKILISEDEEVDKTGCYGNSLLDACRYLYEIGTCTEDCVPYDKILNLEIGDFQKISSFNRDSPASTQLPLCTTVAGPVGDMCVGSHIEVATGEELGKPARFFRAYRFYSLYGKQDQGELQIRREIWRWGPVATGMRVYPDFYKFNAARDIYKCNGKGPQVGGHAIIILGWGEEKGEKYWIIRNSWGPTWGDKGYFKMVRGENNCGIEENVMCVLPDFFYPTGYLLGDARSSSSPDIIPDPLKDNLSPSQHITDHDKTMEGVDTFRGTRDKISDDVLSTAGGIDPITGYTRRVMITRPWLNFQRPVFLEDLPKWATFIAGRDSTPRKRQMISIKLDDVKENRIIENQTNQLYIVVVAILVLFIVIIMGIMVYQKVRT